MLKNTGSQTATTFTLADQHPNFAQAMDRELVAELSRPYVWKTVEGAREAIRLLAEVNGFEHTDHTAPGLEVHAFYVNGAMMTIVVIEDNTVSRLHRAVRHSHPVTVTYVKADGEETVRTIEPRSLSLTKAGDVIVRAADRKAGDVRSFRADRVRTYTVHRTRFTVRLEAPAPSKTELVAAFQGRPVRWTPNPDRTPSPLTATGQCLDPSGQHRRPVQGRCTRCGAVPVYA